MDAYQTKVTAEARQLMQTEFWKMYQTEIDKELNKYVKYLRSAPIDMILKTQGQIAALEYMKMLPTKVLENLGEPSETAPKE